ncbi:MAG: membrane dipeptidase [Firmicutes bacterium]|nr:membrane dipeptidase [Bacillota bacterium]
MFIMDAHCDTLMDIVEGKRRLADKDKGGQLDLPRMIEGGVSAQIFAIYVPEEYFPGAGTRRALQFVDTFYREIEDNSDKMVFVKTGSDVEKARSEGKIAAFLSIEGGEVLEGRIELLRIFYRLGVRLMTLTWSLRNEIADGAFEERTQGGLTRFGIQVVEEMDRLGMVVDVSHLSEAGFWDVIGVSKKPIIASHSNSKTLCPHPRNLSDDQAEAIARKGGVIGINFAGFFLGRGNRSLEGVINHIDYLSEIIGPRHIGLGSDFDGLPFDELPDELKDVSKLPRIADKLAAQGYSDKDIKGIMGENMLRVVKSVIG